ncbi:hypothetical protein V2J09_022313 [Rumex salicifolius]
MKESTDYGEDGKVRALVQFKDRLSMGFDKDLQDLILGEKVFSVLESALCDDSCSPGVRENCAMAIAALAGFNKNVFVGLILMGFSVGALVKMGTAASLHALSLLIRLIKAHLVDEPDLNGEIPRIISKLNSEDSCVQRMALDCVLGMGYFGRKQGVEMLLECGLIEKLVYLQRVGIDHLVDDEEMRSSSSHPFSDCISGFAVQVEVGEGMDKVERKAVKMEIMRRARGACVSEAEAAAILAQLLWGSSP